MIRIEIENKTSAIINTTKESAKPIKNKDNKNEKLDICKGIRLSNFATSQPESGIPIIALAGKIINKFPKSSAERLKLALIVGILDAQEEKQIPDKRK